MVSGARRGSGATVKSFQDAALTENHVVPVPDGNGQARRLVACGSPVDTTQVIIVNSKTNTKAAPGRVGEIWITGASIGQGYWHDPCLTNHSFNAHLSKTGKARSYARATWVS